MLKHVITKTESITAVIYIHLFQQIKKHEHDG